MTSAVRSATRNAVKVITLNRPASLNAMNVQLLEGLIDHLLALRGARAVVLEGAGRAFCTGEDLKETLAPKTGKAPELRVALEMLQQITRLITSYDGIVVAAVQGYAIGGGAELALVADIVVAAPDAKFRFPETAIGHAVTGGISSRLPALIGLARAKDLLMTSRWLGAEEAHGIGLIAEVAPDPRARARDIAREVASYPPLSVASAKRSLELAAQADLERQLRWEVEVAMTCFAAPEAQGIFRSFKSRRPGGRVGRRST
jgi:2-(1,2-epoxy-1,2-dihydrophenyl)acetyl-CoA isomerase